MNAASRTAGRDGVAGRVDLTRQGRGREGARGQSGREGRGRRETPRSHDAYALGFDHSEGRRRPGWRHPMSVVLCAYAVLVAERCLAFPARNGQRSDP